MLTQNFETMHPTMQKPVRPAHNIEHYSSSGSRMAPYNTAASGLQLTSCNKHCKYTYETKIKRREAKVSLSQHRVPYRGLCHLDVTNWTTLHAYKKKNHSERLLLPIFARSDGGDVKSNSELYHMYTLTKAVTKKNRKGNGVGKRNHM